MKNLLKFNYRKNYGRKYKFSNTPQTLSTIKQKRDNLIIWKEYEFLFNNLSYF
jgi:hypothetical protein